jgi:cobalt-zinc-cadmium efflux system protein
MTHPSSHPGHTHADHAHHAHAPTHYNRIFLVGIGLNVGFVLVEATVGLRLNSLGLLADAGHNLSDVLSLVLAWGAHTLGQRPPTARYTYGLRRSSILAAVVNGIILMGAMGAIAWEAFQRLQSPTEVPGLGLIVVAGIGIVINGFTAWLFMAGRDRDLNLQGAFLHMAADALISLGVVLAGIAILTTGWLWFDPVISLVIVAVVVVGTWHLLQGALNLALDAVPAHIQPQAVRLLLAKLPGVAQVHDLHIWAMSTTEVALTAHLVMPEGHPGDRFLSATSHQLQETFGIHHTTLQIELGDGHQPCHLASDHQV